jgi:hypothetical protein
MTRLRAIGLLIVAVALVAVASCGEGPAAPTALPHPLPGLTSLTLTGNTSLTGIGGTSKITATGHFTDGSAKDVSADMLWFTEIPGVLTISSDGLVSAVGLGVTSVFVTRQPVFQSILLTVTPPGTMAVGGWTSEPNGDALPGVLVSETGSGLSVVTELSGDDQGAFAMGGLTNGHLTLAKESFEDARFDVTASGLIGVLLQRVMRTAVGGTLSGRLEPHDMDYTVTPDAHCRPCRLIRVTASAPGILHLKLTWTDAASMLNIWIDGHVYSGTANDELLADVPIGSGELVMYIGKVATDTVGNAVPFTFSVNN